MLNRRALTVYAAKVVVDGCVMLLIRCLFIYCNKGPSFILTKSKSLIFLQTVPTNNTVGL